VVDGVSRVAGRTADAEQEQPAAVVAHGAEQGRQLLDGVRIQRVDQAARFCQECLREAHSVYPALSASRLNICTVSRLYSSRFLPIRCSLVRIASVTVMMSTPISSACTTLNSSRGDAHSSSMLRSAARHIARAARMVGAGSMPASAMRPAKIEMTDG